jgi:hypothetical protein
MRQQFVQASEDARHAESLLNSGSCLGPDVVHTHDVRTVLVVGWQVGHLGYRTAIYDADAGFVIGRLTRFEVNLDWNAFPPQVLAQSNMIPIYPERSRSSWAYTCGASDGE